MTKKAKKQKTKMKIENVSFVKLSRESSLRSTSIKKMCRRDKFYKQRVTDQHRGIQFLYETIRLSRNFEMTHPTATLIVVRMLNLHLLSTSQGGN